MEKFVEILSDKQALIERTLALVVEKIEAAISARGRCTIALAGGSTPKPLYEALSHQPLAWDKLQVFWGDERYVAGDHPDSNQRMARQAWLSNVPIPDSNIHPTPTDGNDPTSDAKKYESQLRTVFKVSESEFPIFDLILLGMGDDGHTASLFPQTEALKIRDRCVTVGNKDGQPRLTFTVPLINQARCVIFIVSGAGKQTSLAQVFAPSASELDYPSRLIQPQGELWWLLDQSAGEGLNS